MEYSDEQKQKLKDYLANLTNPNPQATSFNMMDGVTQNPTPAPMPKAAVQNAEDDSDAAETPDIGAAPLKTTVNPMVVQNLKEKYGLLDPANYDKELSKAKADQASRKDGLGWLQFGAGFGDAIAGRSPASSAQAFNDIRGEIDKNTIGALDAKRAGQMQSLTANNTMDKMQREQDAFDPNSKASIAFRKAVEATAPEIVKRMGEGWQNVSAADKESIFDPIKLKETIDARKQQAQLAQQNRMDNKSEGELMKLQQLAESTRGSPAVAQAEKDLYAASKVKTLLNMYSDPNKMNSQMVNLLVQDVSKIASGGQATQHELEGMQPNTWTGAMAKAWEKVSNEPTPANAGAFIRQYADYTKALSKDAQKIIQDKYSRVFNPYQDRYKNNQVFNSLQDQYLNRFKNSDLEQNDTVTIQTPDGRTGTIPKANLQKALSRGAKVIQ